MPAVTGTHSPGRDEGAEGLRRWSGDIITAFSCCRGSKGQTTMPSGGNVDDTRSKLTQNAGTTGLTATNYRRLRLPCYSLVAVTHDLSTRK